MSAPLSTEIRAATPADAVACLAIYAPLVLETPISFEEEPPAEAEMAGRIERTLRRFPWLAATDDDGLLGYAYAGAYRERAAYRWSAEVSIFIAERARRRGVARALYTALFTTLERQGFRNTYAGITLPNEASVRLHESLGFRRIGVYRGVGFKAGIWHDVGWWGRKLENDAPQPAEPILFADLDHSLR